MTARPRVLSGMGPTGRLHLGNHLGVLDNWVRLQTDFDCFYFRTRAGVRRPMARAGEGAR